MLADQQRLLASFGRRRGRRLRVTKQGLFDTLLPGLGVGDWGIGIGEDARPVDSSLLPDPLWLEIGFGGGEHLAHQATLYPEAGIIGCEPYVNGIAGLLKHIDDHKLGNIRVFTEDARLLLERLPDRSLSRVFVLYPDPWPKARHHKRRLVATKFLDQLARVMKSGSQLRLATDHADYGCWMLERLLPHPDFIWQAKEPDDWLKPWSDWISTRYEQKRLAGMPTYLTFVRQ